MERSHPKIEGVMQASKWLSHRVLLDPLEMEELLEALPCFSIYNVSELVALKEATIPREKFLSKYTDYTAALKEGRILDEKAFKPYFSAAFSCTSDSLYAIETGEGKWIIKLRKPAIQLSFHHFTFSREENVFHSMIHSKTAITWGLQFAYPQLYSNSVTHDLVEVYKDDQYPNTKLFKTLSKWIRRQTTPTPFQVEKGRINATFRLGKACMSWIHKHPQLKEAGLSV